MASASLATRPDLARNSGLKPPEKLPKTPKGQRLSARDSTGPGRHESCKECIGPLCAAAGPAVPRAPPPPPRTLRPRNHPPKVKVPRCDRANPRNGWRGKQLKRESVWEPHRAIVESELQQENAIVISESYDSIAQEVRL